jgi:DnaK suppressor protein
VPAKKPKSKSAAKPAKKKVASKAAKKVAKPSKTAKKSPSKSAVKKSTKVVAKKPAPKKPELKKSAASKPVIVRGKAKTALTSTTAKGATTISVYKPEVEANAEAVVEEKKLLMLPPARTAKQGAKGNQAKKVPQLKPIKGAPVPVESSEGDDQWSATELKSVRSELAKDLIRLKADLAEIESEMDDLIERDGIGAGDDQADAGTKTFEREHEMSLVYNARDMVLQTERALERIDGKTYGRCEDCQNPISKARLKVFPRATLCMKCKAKEERR